MRDRFERITCDKCGVSWTGEIGTIPKDLIEVTIYIGGETLAKRHLCVGKCADDFESIWLGWLDGDMIPTWKSKIVESVSMCGGA